MNGVGGASFPLRKAQRSIDAAWIPVPGVATDLSLKRGGSDSYPRRVPEAQPARAPWLRRW